MRLSSAFRLGLTAAVCGVLALSVAGCTEERPRGGRAGVSAEGVDNQQAQVARMIDDGEYNGTLSRREAERLREELRDIKRREARYRDSGAFTERERRELLNALEDLKRQVRREKKDNNNR